MIGRLRTLSIATAATAIAACSSPDRLERADVGPLQLDTQVLTEKLGPCAVAEDGYQPRIGYALHNLQLRRSNHPERLASLGFMTSCFIQSEDVEMQSSVSLPFLVDEVKVGRYQVRDMDHPGTDLQLTTAFATLLVNTEIGEVEYRSRGGEVVILSVTEDMIEGTYEMRLQAAEAGEIELQGSFRSKPNLDDPATLWVLGRISPEDLIQQLRAQGEMTAEEYEYALATLESEGRLP